MEKIMGYFEQSIKKILEKGIQKGQSEERKWMIAQLINEGIITPERAQKLLEK